MKCANFTPTKEQKEILLYLAENHPRKYDLFRVTLDGALIERNRSREFLPSITLEKKWREEWQGDWLDWQGPDENHLQLVENQQENDGVQREVESYCIPDDGFICRLRTYYRTTDFSISCIPLGKFALERVTRVFASLEELPSKYRPKQPEKPK